MFIVAGGILVISVLVGLILLECRLKDGSKRFPLLSKAILVFGIVISIFVALIGIVMNEQAEREFWIYGKKTELFFNCVDGLELDKDNIYQSEVFNEMFDLARWSATVEFSNARYWIFSKYWGIRNRFKVKWS